MNVVLPLSGLRLLLVEDNAVIAIDSQDALLDAGAACVTVASARKQVFGLANSAEFDAAIIDIHSQTEGGLDIAHALLEAGIPFIFATGYSAGLTLPENMRQVPVVSKPYLVTDLIDALSRAIDNDRRNRTSL